MTEEDIEKMEIKITKFEDGNNESIQRDEIKQGQL